MKQFDYVGLQARQMRGDTGKIKWTRRPGHQLSWYRSRDKNQSNNPKGVNVDRSLKCYFIIAPELRRHVNWGSDRALRLHTLARSSEAKIYYLYNTFSIHEDIAKFDISMVTAQG